MKIKMTGTIMNVKRDNGMVEMEIAIPKGMGSVQDFTGAPDAKSVEGALVIQVRAIHADRIAFGQKMTITVETEPLTDA